MATAAVHMVHTGSRHGSFGACAPAQGSQMMMEPKPAFNAPGEEPDAPGSDGSSLTSASGVTDANSDWVEERVVPRNQEACTMLFVSSAGDCDRLDDMCDVNKEIIHYKNSDQRTAMHLAASEGHLETVRWLVRHGVAVDPKDKWGNTPLADAIRGRFFAIRDVLLENGAAPIGTSTRSMGLSEPPHEYVAVPDDVFSACNILIFSSSGDTAELQEMWETDNKIVLAKDYDARTALHMAAAGGHFETVRWLLDHGSEVNSRDRWNLTPLAHAIRGNFANVRDLLIARGAAPFDVIEAESKKIDAFLKLAAAGDLHSVKSRVVADRAVLSYRDCDDRTVVHYAAFNGRVDVVKWLAANGADVNAKNRWDGTPLLCAIRMQHKQLINFFTKNGGKLFQDGAYEDSHTLPARDCVVCNLLRSYVGTPMSAMAASGSSPFANAAYTAQPNSPRLAQLATLNAAASALGGVGGSPTPGSPMSAPESSCGTPRARSAGPVQPPVPSEAYGVGRRSVDGARGQVFQSRFSPAPAMAS